MEADYLELLLVMLVVLASRVTWSVAASFFSWPESARGWALRAFIVWVAAGLSGVL